jgi:hypothetical protein
LSYTEFAADESEKSGVEVVWVDNEYTKILSDMLSQPNPGSGDEQI